MVVPMPEDTPIYLSFLLIVLVSIYGILRTLSIYRKPLNGKK